MSIQRAGRRRDSKPISYGSHNRSRSPTSVSRSRNRNRSPTSHNRARSPSANASARSNSNSSSRLGKPGDTMERPTTPIMTKRGQRDSKIASNSATNNSKRHASSYGTGRNPYNKKRGSSRSVSTTRPSSISKERSSSRKNRDPSTSNKSKHPFGSNLKDETTRGPKSKLYRGRSTPDVHMPKIRLPHIQNKILSNQKNRKNSTNNLRRSSPRASGNYITESKSNTFKNSPPQNSLLSPSLSEYEYPSRIRSSSQDVGITTIRHNRAVITDLGSTVPAQSLRIISQKHQSTRKSPSGSTRRRYPKHMHKGSTYSLPDISQNTKRSRSARKELQHWTKMNGMSFEDSARNNPAGRNWNEMQITREIELSIKRAKQQHQDTFGEFENNYQMLLLRVPSAMFRSLSLMDTMQSTLTMSNVDLKKLDDLQISIRKPKNPTTLNLGEFTLTNNILDGISRAKDTHKRTFSPRFCSEFGSLPYVRVIQVERLEGSIGASTLETSITRGSSQNHPGIVRQQSLSTSCVPPKSPSMPSELEECGFFQISEDYFEVPKERIGFLPDNNQDKSMAIPNIAASSPSIL